MRTTQIAVIGLFSFIGAALADTPLKPLVGSFPVVSYQNNDFASGKGEIVDDGTLVGVKLTAAAWSSASVPTAQFLTPTASTKFSTEEKSVVQEYVNGADVLKIRYIVEPGYVVAVVSQNMNGVSASHEVVLSSGGAPGELWNGPNLVQVAQGDYTVLTIAGKPPHSELSEKAFIKKMEGESLFEMPYCGDDFCDNGWNYFPDGETTVLKTASGGAGDLYRIFLKVDGQLNYYTFLITAEKSTFINHQYVVPTTDELVTLEHVIQRK